MNSVQKSACVSDRDILYDLDRHRVCGTDPSNKGTRDVRDIQNDNRAIYIAELDI